MVQQKPFLCVTEDFIRVSELSTIRCPPLETRFSTHRSELSSAFSFGLLLLGLYLAVRDAFFGEMAGAVAARGAREQAQQAPANFLVPEDAKGLFFKEATAALERGGKPRRWRER